jgi:hypothetical protein
LCFSQFLLEALKTMFQRLDSRSDIDRWRFGTSGTHPSDLDRRDRNDRHDWYEWGKNLRIHVASH